MSPSQIVLTEEDPGVRGLAIISEDQLYRYRLERTWAREGTIIRALVWVMLNPSVADSDRDDPTVRRVIRFTRDAGFDSAIVVNLFAYRAPDPREVREAVKAGCAVGGERANEYIRTAFLVANKVVFAWGAVPWAKDRIAEVVWMATESNRPIVSLGETKHGYPRHPLYVAATTQFKAFI